MSIKRALRFAVILSALLAGMLGTVPAHADQWNTCPTWDCGKNSFSAETQVHTPAGGRRIADIAVGDIVFGSAPGTFSVRAYKVRKTISHIDVSTLSLRISGQSIETTMDHRFYANGRGWVPAGHLRVGDQIHSMRGIAGKVEGIDVDDNVNTRMYNLVVDEARSFFVSSSGWLVGG
ncbi:polymorphic toxin-type HINT domain-containing protein [Catellatospora sp. NPDC049609]|uniref:polymorphic toxin-type HINT domain-containing protein n=1 Tax=Catellatospora sp. NPDC049609 TaxID=3155505 RepID=UPI00343966FA